MHCFPFENVAMNIARFACRCVGDHLIFAHPGWVVHSAKAAVAMAMLRAFAVEAVQGFSFDSHQLDFRFHAVRECMCLPMLTTALAAAMMASPALGKEVLV